MLHLLRLVLLVFLAVLPAEADTVQELVGQAVKQGRREAVRLTLPRNSQGEAMMQAAERSAAQFYGAEFQHQLRCEQERLERELFADFSRVGEAEEVSASEHAESKETIYLFLSSSVPTGTVRAYLAALDQAGDPKLKVVMRGFVAEGQGNYLARITKKDPGCADLQTGGSLCARYAVPIRLAPALFAEYQISRVPAVIYTDGAGVYRIGGDAGLDVLLEQLNREAGSDHLEQLVKHLRGRRDG